MKAYIVSIILLSFSFVAKAQFNLIPDGLVSSQDESNPHLVYTFKGLMRDYLYSRILPFVKEHFNPEDVIFEEVPRQILIEGKGINRIGDGLIKGDILYRLSIDMQDGKVGYEVQKLSFSNAYLIEPSEMQVESVEKDYIFDKNGEIHQPELKEQVEDYFNSIVSRINSYIKETANVSWDL